MALTDKDILITPNDGSSTANPKQEFTGASSSASDKITLETQFDGSITTLSFDGSEGQLFSISNDLTGTIFAVNDSAGIPSLEIDNDGEVRIAEFSGNVGIGTSAPAQKLHVKGSIIRLDASSASSQIELRNSSGAFRAAFNDNNTKTTIYGDGNGSYPYITLNGSEVNIGDGTSGQAKVLELFVGSAAVTTDRTGLVIRLDGTYSDGRYEHRFRKRDEGGGIPLYIDKTDSVAGSHTAIARFGAYTSNADQFEVYGGMKASGNLTVTGTGNFSGDVNFEGGLVKYHASSNSLKFGDGIYAQFGASDDLRIYHNASDSYIEEAGTGNLNIKSNGTFINFLDSSNNLMAYMVPGGAVGLYHNTSKKFETTSSGATVTGTLAVTGDLNVTGDINTVSVTDLDVADKTITLGKGQTEANSGGSGIIIDGSSASLLWDESDNYWAFNKNLAVTGNLLLTGTPTTTNQSRMIDFTGFDKEGTTDFSDRAYIAHTINTAGFSGSVLVISSQNDSNDGIAFATNSSSQLKHNSNTIWTAGNDGSGSGLDADTVDGINSGSFLRSDATDVATGRITLQYGVTSDFNSIGGTQGVTAFYAANVGGVSNRPDSGNYATGLEFVYHDTSARSQLAAGSGGSNNTAAFYVRSEAWNATNSWTSWYKLWHTGNDGSGSGLDADTVDGINSSSFLRSDAADTGSGKITLTAAEGLEVGGIRGRAIGSQTGDFIQLYERVHIGSPAGWGHSSAAAPSGGLSVYGGVNVATSGSGNLTRNSNTVWDAGNDGSGSGLDADTLDGVNSGSFLRSDAADTFSSHLSSANNISIRFVAPNATDANDGKIAAGLFSTGLNIVGAQTTAGTGRQVRIWGEVITDGGHKYWHANNDGASSGLDADLLDGQQGTYYNNKTYTSTGNAAGSYLGGHYSSGGNEKPNSGTFGAGKLKIAMLGSSNLGFGGAWNDVLWMSSYNGSDVKRSTAFVSSKYDNTSVWVVKQNYDSSSWGTGYLFWNSGNDGAGSGLDADTLDGLQVHTTQGTQNTANTILRTQANGYAHLSWINTPSGVTTNTINKIYSSNDDYIRYVTPATFKSQLGLYHVSNDGSGSGLDADLLDGTHKTGFFVQSGSWLGDLGSNGYTRENGLTMTGGSEFVILSKGGQGSVLIDGAYISYESANGFFGSYTSSYGDASGIRATAANEVSVMQLDGGDANLVVTGNLSLTGGDELSFKTSGGNPRGYLKATDTNDEHFIIATSGGEDIAFKDGGVSGTTNMIIRGDGSMWLRGAIANGTIPYSQVTGTPTIPTNNNQLTNGAGYLTASSTQSKYLRSDTADTATGQIFFDAGFDAHPIMLSGTVNMNNVDRSGFYNLYGINSGSTGYAGFPYGTMIAIGNDKGSQGFGLQIAHERTNTQFKVRGMNDTASAWTSWATIWTSAIDGSGSGLDADLLDGLDLHTARNNEVNKVVRTDSNGYIQAGWINTTSGSTTGTNRIYASNDGYIRYVTPATLISNLGLFTTSNDGSGSGLDADTVDGVQASALTKTTATTTQNMANFDITAVNRLTFNDPGVTEGIKWAGGSLWQIYESPNNQSNAAGHLQFTSGSGNGVKRMTLDTSGHLTIYNDSNDESIFQDDNGNSMRLNGADLRIDFYCDSSNVMRLESNGKLHADNDVVAFSTTISDKRLKDKVVTINNALDKVLKLRGVEYTWNNTAKKGKRDLGIIAQEVEEVLPEIVQDTEMPLLDGNTYKTVDYDKISGVLIEAIKEQQKLINRLEDRLKDLEDKNGEN